MKTDLDRFVTAQAPVWSSVTAELAAGQKRSHWMWFIFPQLLGLGRSGMSVRYALAGLGEARDYLAHPLLGPRLGEASDLVLRHPDRTIQAIFGQVDALKFHSCMTLFAAAAPDRPVFQSTLDVFFDGKSDSLTLSLLAAQSGVPDSDGSR